MTAVKTPDGKVEVSIRVLLTAEQFAAAEQAAARINDATAKTLGTSPNLMRVFGPSATWLLSNWAAKGIERSLTESRP